MRNLGPFLADAWRLSAPYFRSEERWFARLLLAAIVILNLSLVGMDVVLNFWNGAFFDSLQNKDQGTFFDLLLLGRWKDGNMMPGFTLIAAVYIAVAVYRRYLNQWLQIRWRRWLTEHFLTIWLADRDYYRISLTADQDSTGTDNPDQRISDDLRQFCSETLSLGLDLLSNIVTFVSFVGILWSLSGPLTLLGITIPAYLLWVALIYAVVGTVLTHLVGRPLAFLNFQQERVEADFRFSLSRLRENMEGVALHGGEADEKAALHTRFGAVVANWWLIMRQTKFLNALTAGYNQIAGIFPFVVASPRYFSGAIALGGLTRITGAFAQVQSSLSWLVSSYAQLASWRATVDRLTLFHRAVTAARALQSGIAMQHTDETALSLHGDIALPDGSKLLEGGAISFPAGSSTVISGRSGSGKSTLFRALSGIWPFGAATVDRPAGSYLFLPQRPYIPLGTLRHAVCYPGSGDISNETIATALSDVSLGHLIPALDEEASWAQRLSGGEQQRLAVARALLIKPDFLFLDEATASLDPDSEAQMYALLRAQLPAATIVSIAHRPSVADVHDRKLQFIRDGAGTGRIVAAEPG